MADEFDPLTGELLPKSSAVTSDNKSTKPYIPDLTDDELQAMSKQELISLIKRVSGAMWGIGVMTEEEVYEAMLLKLAYNGLTSQDARDSLNHIKEWLDRKKGKAITPVAIQQTITMDMKADTQLLSRIRSRLIEGAVRGGDGELIK